MRSRRALPAPARRRSSLRPARCGASTRTCWCTRISRRTAPRSHGPPKLFPERKNYLDVYDHHGLTGRRAVLAHGVHLGEDELCRCHESGHGAGPLPDLEPVPRLRPVPHRAPRRIRAARCMSGSAPTSAAAPASRCSPRWAPPTRSRSSTGARSSAVEAFYLATLGGARALALDDRIGDDRAGKEADLVVLDPNATPLLTLRNARAESLEDDAVRADDAGRRPRRAGDLCGGQLAHARAA